MGKVSRILPDKVYVSLVYFYHFHRFPNLKNPKTYNEKLQWLKLHDRQEEYIGWVDKVRVKEYIAETLGEQYVIPTLKIWERAEDISLDDMPNQFVLKCNHDSKSCIICKDKKTFDLDGAKKFLDKHLKENAFWYGREWSYKAVKPCVFAEEMLKSPDGDLKDYKVMCFNGKAKLVEIHSHRFAKNYTQDFYDIEWRKTDISQGPTSSEYLDPPDKLNEMLQYSEQLAEGLKHIRVDWYCVGDKLYFGELTFFDGSGFLPFDNPEHDLLLGSWVDLK